MHITPCATERVWCVFKRDNTSPPSFALEYDYESSEYSCSSLHLQTNSAYLLVAENKQEFFFITCPALWEKPWLTLSGPWDMIWNLWLRVSGESIYVVIWHLWLNVSGESVWHHVTSCFTSHNSPLPMRSNIFRISISSSLTLSLRQFQRLPARMDCPFIPTLESPFWLENLLL